MKNNNGFYIRKYTTHWAIVRDKPDGSRECRHVGKPAYILKVWQNRFATA